MSSLLSSSLSSPLVVRLIESLFVSLTDGERDRDFDFDLLLMLIEQECE